MKIYLVRHAQKDKTLIRNSRKRVGITNLGIVQAKAFGRYARSLKIHKIYTSPYKRTFKTAKVIGHELGMKPIKYESIREISIPTYFIELIKSILPLQKKRERHDIIKTLFKISKGKQDVIAVTHAGYIRLLMSLLARNKIQKLKYFLSPYHNLGLTVLNVKNREIEIEEFNNTKFLPKNIRTVWPL